MRGPTVFVAGILVGLTMHGVTAQQGRRLLGLNPVGAGTRLAVIGWN